jgi:1-acyl-sn-glycerol-3-phosphate acyltransferase
MRLVTRDRTRALASAYLRAWHSLEVQGVEHLPSRGPALLLANHASYLDFLVLLAVDPYGDSSVLALASLFRVPLLRQILHVWNAIPVQRRGHDHASVGALIGAARDGRVVAVAVEGVRSRDGCLGPVHPVLAAVAADLRVPLVPVGIAGSQRALPRGALIPRKVPISVRIGEPFTVPRSVKGHDAAGFIRQAIADLLPAEQQPAHSTTEPSACAEMAQLETRDDISSPGSDAVVA